MKNLRLIQTTDYQKIAALDAKCLPYDHPIERWVESVWWLGYVGGKPVCYCGVKKIYGDTGYFNRAGVIPSARGRGYQKKMIQKRVKYCKDEGCKRIITYVAVDNIISAHNLISCGFNLYIPEQEYADNALYFMKNL